MTNQAQTEKISFSTFALSPHLARAVEELHYEEATSIQAAAIPFLLDGQDVIGHSSTGTGKTAAFGVPAVECVNGELKRPQVLVLSPTRELALQITRELQKYAKYKEGVCVATVYGGASMGDQIRLLKRANIVVGTPGRLMDHLRRKTLKMDDVKMAVLDEADEMLSMGFIEDIQTILSHAPSKRQTVLFSATMPSPILKISKEFLSEPQIVDVMTGRGNQADIEQMYYYVPQHKKPDALALLLQHASASRSMVFCNTKTMVDDLAASLRKQGFKATGLHGDMTQAVRSRVMDDFRVGNIEVLVATDVAARGIDVDDVDSVINFDLSQSFEYYIHRIGRTGRAGKAGISQTLVCNSRQLATLKNLMRFTGCAIQERRLPTSEEIMARTVAKEADALMPQMQEAPGKAAQMLVKRLMGAEGSGITAEQVAYTLAEKLLGGDSRFESISAIESSPAESGRQRASGNRFSGEKSSMVTLTANIGRSARVTPNHLVGSIAELLDIPGKNIGKIDIDEDATAICLREEDALALLRHRKPIRILGAVVTFEIQKRKTKPFAPSFKRKKTARKPSGDRNSHSA